MLVDFDDRRSGLLSLDEQLADVSEEFHRRYARRDRLLDIGGNTYNVVMSKEWFRVYKNGHCVDHGRPGKTVKCR